MRRKNAVLLIVLVTVMTGVFLIVSNLKPPGTDLSTVVEEYSDGEEEKTLQDLGIPESPGYVWDDAANAALASIMDISDLENYPVYYFSVPENAEKYRAGIAEELLGNDYGDAEVSSEHMSMESFPGWGDTVTYRLSDDLPTELAVSLYHVSYSDNRQVAPVNKRRDADLVGLTEGYLKKFRWGFWDGTNSCSVLEEKNGSVEVSSVFAGLPADKYEDRTQIKHRDGYLYSVARGKMVFSYRSDYLSGLQFVFSGGLSQKEELKLKYTSVQEIMDAIKANEEKETRQTNTSANNPVHILFEPCSAECCYIIGIHPENPGYKASPWLVD